MTAPLPRRTLPLLACLLAGLLAACSAVPPASPEPTLPATVPASLAPTTSADPSGPAGTPAGPSSAPPATTSPVPSPSGVASPTPVPSPTPALSPSPSWDPGATVPPGPVDAATAARLAQQLESERAARRIPGLSAMVILPDGSRWSGAAGEAELDPARATTPDTPFVVGSITKTFVTALVMQLVEQGRLALDDPLSRWLPDYPRARRISLRQLLNHTSGVFNYFEHQRYNSIVFSQPDHLWTPTEILEQFQQDGYFLPGEGFHYSNTGFVLLGLVIEAAAGASLGEELRRRFFEPLGMLDTYFQGDGPPPPDTAQGYLRSGGGHREISDISGYRPTKSAATVAWAAGNMVSSAQDIATWGRALYGGQLLEPESLAEMVDFGATLYAGGSYGLGTRTRLFQGRRAVGHTGSLRGFTAAMWQFPEENVTMVVLTNLGRIDANSIVEGLAGVILPPATPSPAPPAGSPSP